MRELPNRLNDGTYDYIMVQPYILFDDGFTSQIAIYDREPHDPGGQYTPDLAYHQGITDVPVMYRLQGSDIPRPAVGPTENIQNILQNATGQGQGQAYYTNEIGVRIPVLDSTTIPTPVDRLFEGASLGGSDSLLVTVDDRVERSDSPDSPRTYLAAAAVAVALYLILKK